MKGKERDGTLRGLSKAVKVVYCLSWKEMNRDRMAGSELTKPRAFCQPGCRRGTRCPAVLRMNPHTAMDMYGLTFSLGSVQEVPISYIALSPSFLHRKWRWKPFPSTGLLRVKGTEKGQQWWRLKKKYFLHLWPPVAWPMSLHSPGAGARGLLSSCEGLTTGTVCWCTVDLSTQVSVWGPLAFCLFLLDSQGAWGNFGVWELNPSIIPLI